MAPTRRELARCDFDPRDGHVGSNATWGSSHFVKEQKPIVRRLMDAQDQRCKILGN